MEPPGSLHRGTVVFVALLECGCAVGDPGDKREIYGLHSGSYSFRVWWEKGERGTKGFTMTVCAQRLSHTPNKEHSQQEATACHRKGNFRCHLKRRTDTSSCERPFPALLPYEICITPQSRGDFDVAQVTVVLENPTGKPPSCGICLGQENLREFQQIRRGAAGPTLDLLPVHPPLCEGVSALEGSWVFLTWEENILQRS